MMCTGDSLSDMDEVYRDMRDGGVCVDGSVRGVESEAGGCITFTTRTRKKPVSGGCRR